MDQYSIGQPCMTVQTRMIYQDTMPDWSIESAAATPLHSETKTVTM
jgi:hypothetical protein